MLVLLRNHALLLDTEYEMDIHGRVDTGFAEWKQIAGEVFRAPGCLLLLTVCVGTGLQLLAVAASLHLLCLLNPVFTERNYMAVLLPGLYSLFALLGGLLSASFYTQHRGQYWITAMLTSLLGFPCIAAVTLLSLDHLKAGPPLPYWMIWLRLFLIVDVPLHLLGTIIGRKYLCDLKYPCKINLVQQSFPYQMELYERPFTSIITVGALSFLSIILEVLLRLESFWNYKLSYASGSGLIVLLSSLLCVACGTIWMTFIQLGIKNPRWHWFSFLCGGSIAGYLFLWSLLHYAVNMSDGGWLRCCLFFGYMGLACLCLFLVSGTVGHFAGYYFVRLIYSLTKRD